MASLETISCNRDRHIVIEFETLMDVQNADQPPFATGKEPKLGSVFQSPRVLRAEMSLKTQFVWFPAKPLAS